MVYSKCSNYEFKANKMMCFKDRMFCSSPNCENKCGRKISDKDRLEAQRLGQLISQAYFCDIPIDKNKSNEREDPDK